MDDLRKLYRLDELSDYKVASHYPDIRGWKITDANNLVIGTVDDLIVNKAEERVVYLDLEVDKKLIDDRDTPVIEIHNDDENHLLLPIGAVSIDESNKSVICNDVSYATFGRAKRFRKGENINREYETALLRTYYPNDDSDTLRNKNQDDDFYRRSHFERRG